MTTQYIMRAFKITAPTMHVYWTALGSPDFSATFAPYSPSELTGIVVDYSVTSPIISPGGVPFTVAGGDLVGAYPNPSVAKIQGYSISTTAPANKQVLTWSSTNNKWEPDFGEGSSNVTITTTNYNIMSSDYVIIVGTLSAAITIYMPSSPVTGDTYIIKDSNGSASTHNITINGNGKNIDASPTFVINSNYSSATLMYNGTNWNLL